MNSMPGIRTCYSYSSGTLDCTGGTRLDELAPYVKLPGLPINMIL